MALQGFPVRFQNQRPRVANPSSDSICLTVDVEWAHKDILAWMLHEFDIRKLKATFFCTHAGVSVEGHERGLHPNFRRTGDTLTQFLREIGPDQFASRSDEEVLRYVVKAAQAYAPEAIGVRPHSLFYCSELVPIYLECGLVYHSGIILPLATGLRPFVKDNGFVEMPIYYMDHLDIIAQISDFHLENLALESAGMKVFDFHPNMVFINAHTNQDYLDSKVDYHNPDGLLKRRRGGRGVRTLFLELLDFLAAHPERCRTLAQVHQDFMVSKTAARTGL